MQSAGQYDEWPSEPGTHQTTQPQHFSPRAQPSLPLMSANVNGPVDPHDFYRSLSPVSAAALASQPPRMDAEMLPTSRSFSQSSEPRKLRAPSIPTSPTEQRLNYARSHPVLSSRQPGTVKNIAHKFNQGDAAGTQPGVGIRTSDERYRRPIGARAITAPRSPSSPPRSDSTTTKLLKKRSAQKNPPPKPSPNTSFDTAASFSSTGTSTSVGTQPYPTTSPRIAKSPLDSKQRPLFGEITADGQWNGNFDLLGYGDRPDLAPTTRRGSEPSGTQRLQKRHSHTDMLHPGFAQSGKTLNHKRSRSDMDTGQFSHPPQLPSLDPLNHHYSTGRSTTQQTSRIPVRGRRQSVDSASPLTQPPSLSNPASRSKLTKSPPRTKQAGGKENDKPSTLQSRRYNPPSLANSPQLLSAKVVAPPPKISPPLRSSRPRQPVSSATTAASRARAAGLQQRTPSSPNDKRPSEQWLGKPYDPQQERTRRKIPDLGKIDFAERRARIQKAISQNLEEAKSLEDLRSRSRRSSKVDGTQTTTQSNPNFQGVNSVDQHQADELNHETDFLESAPKPATPSPAKLLSVHTTNLSDAVDREASPNTAGTEGTEFEFDDSPVIGRDAIHSVTLPGPNRSGDLQLLSSATYQPPSKKHNPPLQQTQVTGQSPLEEQSPFAADTPSDTDGWALGPNLDNHGSIRIMLDDDPTVTQHTDQWSKAIENQFQHISHDVHVGLTDPSHDQAAMINGFEESPIDPMQDFNPENRPKTTRQKDGKEDDLVSEPTAFQPATAFAVHSDEVTSDPAVLRAISEYQSTGRVSIALLQELDRYTIDLNRISANGGSDAMLVQNLLDSIAAQQHPSTRHPKSQHDQSPSAEPDLIPITPHTPPSASLTGGIAIIYGSNDHQVEATPERRSQDAVIGSDDEDDFAAQIRRADAQWAMRQHGDESMFANEDEFGPTPPPKDDGYTPRSSIGPASSVGDPSWAKPDLHLSTPTPVDHLQGENSEESFDSVLGQQSVSSPTIGVPPPPSHAPPAPPPLSALPHGLQDLSQAQAASVDQNNELSPRLRKNFWPSGSGSSRPSTDSQRPPPPIPTSLSMSSFADSTQPATSDAGADGLNKSVKATSPSPEQKRLQKRRHIIKELLDTENSYHQDLKIIEDIYKATVSEIVTPEDRKTLFGNCDEIERFSLQFYDQLRKAVVSVYIPSKNTRWGNRRGSMSTTQSDATGQGGVFSSEPVDEDRDRATFIGKIFLENLQHMEQLYGAYLRNHDAANQRLSALQSNIAVKCWLDECHNNASDITSAWDLDSLLVKPTQRVSKYPLILQQLLETTSADHPDHEPLKTAAKESVGMLTRINDAKKRADLVEQMISGKRKETDVRSGLAKAFGRRTERLKERVGINEAFQDPDFDALAQQFSGHYIRLQISMRDVQDYVNRADKAVEQVNNYAAALELFTDVLPTRLPEIESKWRRYGQTVRELTAVSMVTHKAAIQKRVITPMITLIKMHDNPQAAINKRKKRIVDYARCKSIEKRGEKPDKKTVEASEMYEALNDQLKLDLPKLYELTGKLVRECLKCFLAIQLEWQETWDRKLRPILDAKDIPQSIQEITPAFIADYELVKSQITELGICNGAALADSANFLSPASTFVPDSDSSTKRPFTLDSSKRATSMGSDGSPSMQTPSSSKRQSGAFTPDVPPATEIPVLPSESRVRSSSSVSTRGHQTPTPLTSANRPWSNSNTTPPSSAYPGGRPSTSSFSQTQPSAFSPVAVRSSVDQAQFSRPGSSATYFTARPDQYQDHNNNRFSGIFNSAMPPSDTPPTSTPSAQPTTPFALDTPTTTAPADMPVLFVCASLFEFNIDKARKEAGYPYLTYDQGEVFDVVAQKGELWLAKNQDDADKTLGWIWEQHFVILSQN